MTQNKTALLTRITALRKELDELFDFVISIEEAQPVQATPISSNEPDLWLTPKQVCKHLNIAYTTFFEWVRQGKLPPRREFSSKAKRWRISDIKAWQEGRQNSSTINVIIPELVKRRGRPSKIRRKEEFLCLKPEF